MYEWKCKRNQRRLIQELYTPSHSWVAYAPLKRPHFLPGTMSWFSWGVGSSDKFQKHLLQPKCDYPDRGLKTDKGHGPLWVLRRQWEPTQMDSMSEHYQSGWLDVNTLAQAATVRWPDSGLSGWETASLRRHRSKRRGVSFMELNPHTSESLPLSYLTSLPQSQHVSSGSLKWCNAWLVLTCMWSLYIPSFTQPVFIKQQVCPHNNPASHSPRCSPVQHLSAEGS